MMQGTFTECYVNLVWTITMAEPAFLTGILYLKNWRKLKSDR